MSLHELGKHAYIQSLTPRVHVASGSHAISDPINGSTNPSPSLLYDGTVDAILHNKKR